MSGTNWSEKVEVALRQAQEADRVMSHVRWQYYANPHAAGLTEQYLAAQQGLQDALTLLKALPVKEVELVGKATAERYGGDVNESPTLTSQLVEIHRRGLSKKIGVPLNAMQWYWKEAENMTGEEIDKYNRELSQTAEKLKEPEDEEFMRLLQMGQDAASKVSAAVTKLINADTSNEKIIKELNDLVTGLQDDLTFMRNVSSNYPSEAQKVRLSAVDQLLAKTIDDVNTAKGKLSINPPQTIEPMIPPTQAKEVDPRKVAAAADEGNPALKAARKEALAAMEAFAAEAEGAPPPLRLKLR